MYKQFLTNVNANGLHLLIQEKRPDLLQNYLDRLILKQLKEQTILLNIFLNLTIKILINSSVAGFIHYLVLIAVWPTQAKLAKVFKNIQRPPPIFQE